MYLIVGIGNPGQQYTNTPHNIGFSLIDLLANSDKWKKDKHSLIQKTNLDAYTLVLCKPITYVNLSGEAVLSAQSYYKIPAENTVVVSDDVNLPLGSIRIRRGGSHGGHNGLKNIIQHCGENFVRIRIGVGLCPPDLDLSDYVLHQMDFAERKALEDVHKLIREIILCGIKTGWEKCASGYNRVIGGA